MGVREDKTSPKSHFPNNAENITKIVYFVLHLCTCLQQ